MKPERVAVVTGATSGIGAATARLLASKPGYAVVACGRRKIRLAELESAADNVTSVPVDLTSEDATREVLTAAESHWGRVPDVFVLCAGRGLPGTVLTSEPAKWHEIVELNFLAALHQLREVASVFMAADAGAVRDIVVIGSTVGRQISSANPVYGSTKFALHSLVEALRQEICAHNIRVSLIEPGFVRSEFQQTAAYDMAWFEQVERASGPLLAPEDVAVAVDVVISQPDHVHIDDLRIRPTRQRV